MGMMAESDDDDHRMSMVTLVTAMIYHSRHLSLGIVSNVFIPSTNLMSSNPLFTYCPTDTRIS